MVHLCKGIGKRGMATKDKEFPVSTHIFQKCLETWMVPDINLMPVVQSRPLEVFVVYPKTEGMDQMEHQFGSPAQAGDITGVGRYLGLIEDHMEGRVIKCPMFDRGDGTSHDLARPTCSVFLIHGLGLAEFAYDHPVNGQTAQLAKAVQDRHLVVGRDLWGGIIDPQDTVGGLVYRKGNTDHG